MSNAQKKLEAQIKWEFDSVRFTNKKLLNKKLKAQDIESASYLHSDKYYLDQVFDASKLKDVENIDLQLEFCQKPAQRDMWRFYRNYFSALRWRETMGRRFNILVKDNSTKKYLGILTFCSDIGHLKNRDDWIGWSNDAKFGTAKRLNNFVNLACCVPIGNFGFNCNGGKLLASLAFSSEVNAYYTDKYDDKLAGFMTTSLYGKSIMYDRIPHLIYKGLTKGFGSVHLPPQLKEKCKEYLRKYTNRKMSGQSTLIIANGVLSRLKLSSNYLNHGDKRGIYVGFFGEDDASKNYLQAKTDKLKLTRLKSAKSIFSTWVERWAKQRFNHLKNTERLKTFADIKNECSNMSISDTELGNLYRTRYLARKKETIGKEAFTQNKREEIRLYRARKALKGKIGPKIFCQACKIPLMAADKQKHLGKLKHTKNMTEWKKAKCPRIDLSKKIREL